MRVSDSSSESAETARGERRELVTLKIEVYDATHAFHRACGVAGRVCQTREGVRRHQARVRDAESWADGPTERGGESTFRGELDESPVAEIDDTRRIQTIRLIRRRVTSETLHGHGDDRRVARAKTRTRKACSRDISQILTIGFVDNDERRACRAPLRDTPVRHRVIDLRGRTTRSAPAPLECRSFDRARSPRSGSRVRSAPSLRVLARRSRDRSVHTSSFEGAATV